MTPQAYQSPYRDAAPGRAGLMGRLLRAEWTKLRSVPRWAQALLATVVLTIAVALLSAAGSQSHSVGGGGDPGAAPEFRDQGHFVHQPLTGDGSITARVTEQQHSHAWAKAGLMIRQSLSPGSPYAAVMVTPEHGVRLQANFTTDVAGGRSGAPHWLRLTRAGDSITAYSSPNGADWHTVGTVTLDGLPRAAAVGMFVTSPDAVKLERQFGGESIDQSTTLGRATFDQVSLAADGTRPGGEWRDGDPQRPSFGESSRSGGAFTLVGSGDIGPFDDEYRDDPAQLALVTVIVGLVAIVALAVLFMTAEYKRGTIRVTLAAAPQRGRVLAAKALVIGAAAFVTGIVAAVGALLVTRLTADTPSLQPSLADGPVARAAVGTGLLVAAVAVLSLAVGAIVRRSAVAITLVLLVLLVPWIAASGLPLSAALWLERVTPAAGFAIQQTVDRYDTAIAPWAGLGVLCGYAAAALAVATWLVRRRDA